VGKGIIKKRALSFVAKKKRLTGAGKKRGLGRKENCLLLITQRRKCFAVYKHYACNGGGHTCMDTPVSVQYYQYVLVAGHGKKIFSTHINMCGST
jgi:hypothetical protein